MYAKGTKVTEAKTRLELEKVLRSHGATDLSVATSDTNNLIAIAFTIDKSKPSAPRRVRLIIPLPKQDDFRRGRSWRYNSESKQKTLCAQARRERHRVMLLFLKAKLELIAMGVSTVEREFLADVLLPNGQTVYQHVQSQIAAAYAGETVQKGLLLAAHGE